MSNVPPSGDPSNLPPQGNFSAPPPQYAGYTRPGGGTDPDQLQALADGYFGLTNVFYVNIALVLAFRALLPQMVLYLGAVTAYLIAVGVIFAAVAALSYPKNKLVGEGAGWGQGTALMASLLMGINSALCCGIIGYIVVQNIAVRKMKEFGVQGGFFGIKKPLVYARIEQLRSQQSMPAAPPPGL